MFAFEAIEGIAMRRLQLGVVQMRALAGDIDANVATMRAFMARAAGASCDFVCFPEACVTGYSTARADEVAIAGDDVRLAALEDDAHKLGFAVSYGFIERCEGALHIAHVISGREGRLVYRKTHLG